ncbi:MULTISPECIES: cytochrome P450 [Halolamina]|uniref:Cytochrome P450 n=1 Tax=Halolamina pelagica TaxID=699431 RepID=A0A1I5TR99_9EURY|nr:MULTISPECIES: cytochrome P450 [Halolamina]NHX37776.1 cytochrome P450 [Halolamina sp. R1-12]SFP85570.1 Cytochrome P450 [Halolamina pelagica]
MPSDTSGEFPPGPDGLPVVGAVPQSILGGLEFTESVAHEYGDVVHWEGLGEHFYQFNHPEHIAHVLVHNNTNYVKGEQFQRILRPLTGNGILNSEGEAWRRNRRLMQPAFHPDRISVYGEMMTDQTARLLDDWSAGETRSIHEDMMELTLRIVAEALFGVDIDRYVDEIEAAMNSYLPATASLSNLLVPEGVPLPSRRKMASARATLDEVVDDIIAQKRDDPGADDVISMLLEAQADGAPLDDEQIRDEAITLLTAGHETTAVSLTYTTYLLAQHSGIEEKLVAELEAVLGGERPTMADLPDLTYTERVVEESMRLFPPVPSIVRETKESDHVGGYEIPAGSRVFLSQWVVHRDDRWYDDPLAFRPERWTDDLRDSLPQLAYFPFSAGPRRCIGDRFAMLEARLILAMLYQQYHLELTSGRTVEVIQTVTSRPDEEIRMRLHER